MLTQCEAHGAERRHPYGVGRSVFAVMNSSQSKDDWVKAQQHNKKCRQHEDYVSGDLTDDMIYQKVLARVAHYTSSDGLIQALKCFKRVWVVCAPGAA